MENKASENKRKENTATEEDEELSALLDSAVKDFEKAENSNESKAEDKTESKTIPSSKPTPPDTLWTEDFLRSNPERLNQNFSSLFSPGPDGTFSMEQFRQEIHRLAEATTQAAGLETSPDAEFSSIIAQTLRNLSEGTENINNQFSDEALMNMLSSLGNLADSDSDPGDLMPFMQKMMQNLLSKEILQPALSSLVDKYPGWLENNKSTLSAEDANRYEKQLNIMRQVCVELDGEGADDSSDVKRARFDRLLVLMQEMQDCGQPPAELVGDMGPILDEQGAPQIPPGMSPEQCVLQ